MALTRTEAEAELAYLRSIGTKTEVTFADGRRVKYSEEYVQNRIAQLEMALAKADGTRTTTSRFVQTGPK